MVFGLGRSNVIVSEVLPNEKIENLRFVYIVIDSVGDIHYEFNNKGHIVSPFHWNELNPWNIMKNLPSNLVARSVSEKNNIVGVLQLWIYYTLHHIYARVKAAGILDGYQKQGYWKKLNIAMDAFCVHYGVEFVERETNVIPADVLVKMGFMPAKSFSWAHRFENFVTSKQAYVKWYKHG